MPSSNSPPQKQNGPAPASRLVRFIALLITIALVLGAAALVVFRDRLNIDALRRWISYRSLATSDDGTAEPFPYAGGDDLSLACLNSGIVLNSASGAHYYSFTGEQYAEEVLTMEHPILTSTESAAVAYDAGSQSLFVFRNGEEDPAFALEEIDSILSARINSSGWLALTTQQSGFKGAVTVYNSSGTAVIQISLSSTFVVDAALSPDCKTVAVVCISQSGGTFQSKLIFYPVSTGEADRTVSLGSTMVLDLDYEKDRIWVLGEDSLSCVEPEGTDEGNPLVNSWSFGHDYLKGCNLNGDGFALLLLGSYRLGAADRAVTIGSDCTILSSLALNGQVLSYDCAGNYCSLLTGSALTIYDQKLTPYAVNADPNGARYTALAADGSAVLADSQKAWLYIPG